MGVKAPQPAPPGPKPEPPAIGPPPRKNWYGAPTTDPPPLPEATAAKPCSHCSRGQAGTAYTTVIVSLPSRSVQLLRPIPAAVEPKSGVYMASLVDADICASGESPRKAVDNLKDILVAKFHLFSQKENILGEQPRRQLHVLRRFLRAKQTQL